MPIPTLASMRRLIPLILTFSMLTSACVAGGDIISASPGDAVTTLPELVSSTTIDDSVVTEPTVPPDTTTTTIPPRPEGVVTAETVFNQWGSVDGLTMFRGNPTRTYFGSGPVPATAPDRLWRYPESPMSGQSPVGSEPKVWSGTGWTGQPLVYERDDGKTELIFGAYDKYIHFLDADTSEALRPRFDMGDIIKGTITLDPDGFPLLYAGSRDPRFRILALDGDEVTEVWSLHAKAVEGMWNDDWDSNPVVVDDMLYVGGENSWWFAIKLNRGYDDEGKVIVDPQIVYQMPAWTDELFDLLGRQHSIENSTAIFDQKAYFATSGGRVVGVDISDVENGNAEVFFDWWMGDDIDSTITIDKEGYLYVVAHADHEKTNNTAARRVREVGQLVKLDTSVEVGDPLTSLTPIVWSVEIPAARGQDTGVWATPALHSDGVIYVPTDSGDLLAIDTDTGETVWSGSVGVNAWSSPAIVDDTLVIAVDCFAESALRAYDITDPLAPRELWTRPLATGSCIESTPAVWNGNIYVGARDGFMYAFGS